MVAMRGGAAIGSLATGLTIEVFGVREALLANAALAMIVHLVLGRAWRRTQLVDLPQHGTS